MRRELLRRLLLRARRDNEAGRPLESVRNERRVYHRAQTRSTGEIGLSVASLWWPALVRAGGGRIQSPAKGALHMVRIVTSLFVLPFLLVGQAAAVDPLSDPISADRPLFIFAAPGADATDSLGHADQILSAWQALPAGLRPYSVLQIESPATDENFWPERFSDVLRELQFASIPVIVSIANENPRSTYPLDQLRKVLEEFTHIRGVHVEGLRFNEFPSFGGSGALGTPPQALWLTEAIRTAVEFGRLITIELDELHWARIMSNTWCQTLYATIQANAAHAIPLNRQQGPQNITRSSTLLGSWLEGAVDQWGLQCSSAWFRSAGFLEPGVFGRGTDGAVMPPSLYRAMILNGAIAGATVYRFDRADELWTNAESPYWNAAIAPTLDAVLGGGYIARKDLVQSKTKLAYRLNPASNAQEFRANLVDIDAVYESGHMLQGAYGVERAGQVPELVPNTGRHYWIPILSPYASDEVLRQFEEVMLPGALPDGPSWRERLDLYYTPDGDGNAFISQIGRNIFVLHTRENSYEEQVFRLNTAAAPVRGITAQRGTDGVALSWPFREGDVFYQVHRRILPETEFTLLASDVDGRRYIDTTAGSDDTTAYSVTALTNERAPYEGTVNYGDYLVFSTASSRIDEEVLLDPFTSSATSVPLPPRVDTRPKFQPWWPTGLEQAGTREGAAGAAIAATIEAWETAFQAEDLDSVLDFYAPGYRDTQGNTLESVRAAYGLFFELYQAGYVVRQVRDWDFASLAGKSEVSLTLYCRFTGVDEIGPMGRMVDLPVSFPDTVAGEVRLTFSKEGDAWRVLHSDASLPALGDILPGR